MASSNLELLPGVKPGQTISEFFRDKNVFITGGNGFMGKVLIEKLLRSCPGIGNIYILMRDKKGISAQDRWNKETDYPLFDKLKQTNKNALNKVVIIKGDVQLIGLGLSIDDRKMLMEKISIVFHAAATVIFNAPLTRSILLNVRGTREVCKLVLDIKKISVFMHVSTCYCQGDSYKVVEEKLYKPCANPYEIIKLAEKCDPITLSVITSKMTEGWPNTYTFTKQLAESVVMNICEGRVPTVIYRPSIVTISMKDPIEGWIDNKFGPVGLLEPIAKGLMRVLLTKEETSLDMMPVDTSVHGMIKATWIQQYKSNDNISVYNSSAYQTLRITNKQLIDGFLSIYLNRITALTPFWYPHTILARNLSVYWILTYIYQVIPSLFLDTILKLTGQKPQLLYFQTKIIAAQTAFSIFMNTQYIFKNEKYKELDNYLLEEDKNDFRSYFASLDPDEWFFYTSKLFPKVVLKDHSDCNRNRVILNRLKYIYYILLWIMYGVFGMLAYKWVPIPTINGYY